MLLRNCGSPLATIGGGTIVVAIFISILPSCSQESAGGRDPLSPPWLESETAEVNRGQVHPGGEFTPDPVRSSSPPAGGNTERATDRTDLGEPSETPSHSNRPRSPPPRVQTSSASPGVESTVSRREERPAAIPAQEDAPPRHHETVVRSTGAETTPPSSTENKAAPLTEVPKEVPPAATHPPDSPAARTEEVQKTPALEVRHEPQTTSTEQTGDSQMTAPSAAGDDCLSAGCHKQLQEAPRVHGPVSVGACHICHAPVADSEHRFRLLRSGNELCTQCHTLIERELANLPHAHGPAASDCTACHQPHGGEKRFFLRAEGPKLCLSCHDSIAEKVARDAVVHGALDTEAGCLSCHTPHASAYQAQLRAVSMELCLNCHSRALVNPETGKRIADMSQVLAAEFKHGPIKNGDCQGCHFPHSAPHANLLRQSYPAEFYKEFAIENYALCFSCHEKTLVTEEYTLTLTRFRDGELNLHYLHVNQEKGRTCRACHEVHASDQPSHIRHSVPFGKLRWQLPLNFEKTETGGSCRPGCHNPEAYDTVKAVKQREREPRPSMRRP